MSKKKMTDKDTLPNIKSGAALTENENDFFANVARIIEQARAYVGRTVAWSPPPDLKNEKSRKQQLATAEFGSDFQHWYFAFKLSWTHYQSYNQLRNS